MTVGFPLSHIVFWFSLYCGGSISFSTGTALLNHVLQKARDHGNIDNIYLHVQINNEDALAFYRKFDFHSVETKEQYYKRIDPPHAHVLQKDMRGCMTAAEPPVPPELSTNVTDTDSMD
ncbi:N-alpha-acetyltransferase 50 [Geodia barretti]|uniref:N-terminal methionine N(alpha)-acetyltransferase NatE n=1 Tax=Geodia barretti TaxID=519541 RepID=A0AA35W2Y8_GEOBA|nr:N-alpha-acetyltransferase 50 [Geodia barretti]